MLEHFSKWRPLNDLRNYNVEYTYVYSVCRNTGTFIKIHVELIQEDMEKSGYVGGPMVISDDWEVDKFAYTSDLLYYPKNHPYLEVEYSYDGASLAVLGDHAKCYEDFVSENRYKYFVGKRVEDDMKAGRSVHARRALFKSEEDQLLAMVILGDADGGF